ncbi:MAG: hypothetical protein NVS9B4_18630 [Candidatus Acidiferrum sp.]
MPNQSPAECERDVAVSGNHLLGIVPLPIHEIDPLADPRWDSFIAGHFRASLFHSRPWLEALRRTYSYEPVAFTTTPPGQSLRNAITFCRVNSWLTGNRLVSLPFSDHCELLVDEADDLNAIFAELERRTRIGRWAYVELRPITPVELSTSLFHSTMLYHFHQLDLRPDLKVIFANFHKDSIQRKIRRAEREGLVYKEGPAGELFERFYRMFTMTRRRHRVPPQPKNWFHNLIDTFGDTLKIRMAFRGDLPVASMLTIVHKDTFVYKYGCSDVRHNNLGGMHLLFWRSIQQAKSAGLRTFDFGRCDSDQTGLITFKRRWGATESSLQYSRYAAADNAAIRFPPERESTKMKAAKWVFSHAPVRVLSVLGRVLYRHVG